MKNLLLLLFLSSLTFSAFGQCEPNPNLPSDFIGIDPLSDSTAPCDTIVPEEPAYIEMVYPEQLFTVFIPDTIDAGVVQIILDNVSVVPFDDPNPGMTGLPSGLRYDCNPPTCIFPAGEGGCLEISGTPDGTNTPGLYDLEITATIASQFINGDIRFPLPADPADYNDTEQLLSQFGVNLPDCPYQINLLTTSTNDIINSQLSIGQNTPNPVKGITTIPVIAENGDYNFTVYNSVGQLIQEETLSLNGQENVEFDATNLDAGIYFYSFSNENGAITKRMIVQ